ncbi:MAG TPA: hypothetical protein VGM25_04095 [Caulobacteraceae bacterium]
MRKLFVVVSAVALSLNFAAVMSAKADGGGPYKLDKSGRCRDKDGHYAKMDKCGGASAVKAPATAKTAATTTPAVAGPYKLDAKGSCRDVKGRLATKDKCKAA